MICPSRAAFPLCAACRPCAASTKVSISSVGRVSGVTTRSSGLAIDRGRIWRGRRRTGQESHVARKGCRRNGGRSAGAPVHIHSLDGAKNHPFVTPSGAQFVGCWRKDRGGPEGCPCPRHIRPIRTSHTTPELDIHSANSCAEDERSVSLRGCRRVEARNPN